MTEGSALLTSTLSGQITTRSPSAQKRFGVSVSAAAPPSAQFTGVPLAYNPVPSHQNSVSPQANSPFGVSFN